MKKRSLATQRDFTFNTDLFISSVNTSDFFGFSGNSSLFKIDFQSGKILCQGHFIDSYQSGDVFNFSGNISNTYDLFINGSPKIIGASIPTGEYDWILFSENALQGFNADVYGDYPIYNINGDTFLPSGFTTLTGRIVNNSDQRIRFFSGECQDTNFYLSNLTTTNLNPGSTGNFLLTAPTTGLAGEFNLPLFFYTNFGNFLYDYNITGEVNVTKDILFSFALSDNLVYYQNFANTVVSYYFPSDYKISAKLEYISGSGNYYIDIPISGTQLIFSDPTFIVESGRLTKSFFFTGYGTGGLLNLPTSGVISGTVDIFQWATGDFTSTIQVYATGLGSGRVPDYTTTGSFIFAGPVSGYGNWLSGFSHDFASGWFGINFNPYLFSGQADGAIVHFNKVWGAVPYFEPLTELKSSSRSSLIPQAFTGLLSGIWSGNTFKSGYFGTNSFGLNAYRVTGQNCQGTETLSNVLNSLMYFSDPFSTGNYEGTGIYSASGYIGITKAINYSGYASGMGSYTPNPSNNIVNITASSLYVDIATGWFCGLPYTSGFSLSSTIIRNERNSYLLSSYTGELTGRMINASGIFPTSGYIPVTYNYHIEDGSGTVLIQEEFTGSPGTLMTPFLTGRDTSQAFFNFGTPQTGDYIRIGNNYLTYGVNFNGVTELIGRINSGSYASGINSGSNVHLYNKVLGLAGNNTIHDSSGFNFNGFSGGADYYSSALPIDYFVGFYDGYVTGSGFYTGQLNVYLEGLGSVLDWTKTFAGSWNFYTGNYTGELYNYLANTLTSVSKYEKSPFSGTGMFGPNDFSFIVQYINSYPSGTDVCKLTVSGINNFGFVSGIEILFTGQT